MHLFLDAASQKLTLKCGMGRETVACANMLRNGSRLIILCGEIHNRNVVFFFIAFELESSSGTIWLWYKQQYRTSAAAFVIWLRVFVCVLIMRPTNACSLSRMYIGTYMVNMMHIVM